MYVEITSGKYKGEKGRVVYRYKDGSLTVDIGDKCVYYPYLLEDEYRKIDDGSPKSTEDLIANLAHRMSKIERKLSEIDEQVDSNTKDIRTIGEESAKAKFLAETAEVNNEIAFKDVEERLSLAEETIEMLTDDIVILDERTQDLVETKSKRIRDDDHSVDALLQKIEEGEVYYDN